MGYPIVFVMAMQVRHELLALKAQYDDARRQVLAEIEMRVDVERRHEALVRDWRGQLEAREKEFESLQQHLAPPRDLEMLKVQVRFDTVNSKKEVWSWGHAAL